MPVSHLALTVSHIPDATQFYLAALKPLGYRYIGQSGSFGCRKVNGAFAAYQALILDVIANPQWMVLGLH